MADGMDGVERLWFAVVILCIQIHWESEYGCVWQERRVLLSVRIRLPMIYHSCFLCVLQRVYLPYMARSRVGVIGRYTDILFFSV